MADTAAEFMRAYDVPGLGVAIVRQGDLVYDEAFGFADKEAGTTLTAAHRFRIASVSKPITAVAIFTLIEQRALGLQDRVFGRDAILANDFGPIPAGSQLDQVTVEHLLTHTAGGWPNDGNDPMFHYPQLDHAALIASTLKHQPLTSQPGTKYAYSNFGYCVLGRVIEKVTRRSYASYVQEALLGRAGIRDMEIAGNTLADRRPQEVRYYGQASENPYRVNVRRMDAHGGWLARPAALAIFASHVDGFSRLAGVFSQLEKTRLVKKLKAALVRRRAEDGKCEGRKSFAEMASVALEKHHDSTLADMIAMAKRLHRANPKTGKRLSLQKISDALAKAGHLNERGQPYNPKSVRSMIRGARSVLTGRT